ncbi:hypothetical protein A2U01_0050031, partial [Trifolium medium]|nr:hypothetical protein [Trifolium medium]
ISAILLFVVPPDLPLGFDGPPMLDAVVRILFSISSLFGSLVVGLFGSLVSPPIIAATNGLLPGSLPSSLLSTPFIFDHFDPLLGGFPNLIRSSIASLSSMHSSVS